MQSFLLIMAVYSQEQGLQAAILIADVEQHERRILGFEPIIVALAIHLAPDHGYLSLRTRYGDRTFLRSFCFSRFLGEKRSPACVVGVDVTERGRGQGATY